MKKLFSFIMVGLAFTVLQVSISQAQGTSSDVATETSKQGGVLEDEGGRVKVWNRQTHGAKQGRQVPGTKTSGNYADEESKAGEHQNAHEKQNKEQSARDMEARIKKCIANGHGKTHCDGLKKGKVQNQCDDKGTNADGSCVGDGS